MKARLSDQGNKIKDGTIPFPMYTCLHVKSNVSAKIFQEWYEFTPYEVSIPKYGVNIKTQDFASKFFMGEKIKSFPEVRLHFLYGIWGSAFTIQFKRLMLGAKYLGFFSSRSLKTRERYITFAQFVYFLREVCLLFNF